MKESTFEKKFIARLKKLPYSYWEDKGETGAIRGLTDRRGCVRGRYIGLEFKRSMAEALSNRSHKRLQEYTVHQIQEAGGYGTFVYPENAEVVYEYIKEIAHGK